jgi:hypothetical protein
MRRTLDIDPAHCPGCEGRLETAHRDHRARAGGGANPVALELTRGPGAQLSWRLARVGLGRRADGRLGRGHGARAPRRARNAARSTVRCVRGPAGAGLLHEAISRCTQRHFGRRKGEVGSRMAKRAVRRPAERSVAGQERDAAVCEGPPRDSELLAFASMRYTPLCGLKPYQRTFAVGRKSSGCIRDRPRFAPRCSVETSCRLHRSGRS